MSRHARPLRFDRPKVLGVAAVCAAALGVLLLGAGGTPRPPTATSPSTAAAASPAPAATAVSSPAPVPATPASPGSSASPVAVPAGGSVPQWRAVATRFAVAFTAPPTVGHSWAGGLAPWVSPALAAAYAHTSTDRLPEGRLLKVQSTTEADTSVVATVDYDSGLQLVIELVPGPSGSWRVVTVLTAPTNG